jgi:hypothetical protein
MTIRSCFRLTLINSRTKHTERRTKDELILILYFLPDALALSRYHNSYPVVVFNVRLSRLKTRSITLFMPFLPFALLPRVGIKML